MIVKKLSTKGNLPISKFHLLMNTKIATYSDYSNKANTYAKSKRKLQRTLDVFWVVHNFIRVYFTTKVVPAVKLEIIKTRISWSQILTIRYAF